MLSYVSFLNPKLLLPSATRKCLNTSRFYVAFSSWRCGSASQTKFQASAAASSSTSLPPFANKLVFPPIDDIGDLAVDPWLLRWTSDRVKLKVDCPRLAKHIDTYQCISDVCHSLSLFNNIFTIFYTLSMLIELWQKRSVWCQISLGRDLQRVSTCFVQIIMFKSFNAQVILSHVKGCSSRLWWLRESPQQQMYTNVASRGLFWGSHGHFIFASDSINVSSMYSMNFQWIFNVQ